VAKVPRKPSWGCTQPGRRLADPGVVQASRPKRPANGSGS
jgi:hypothetical protein